MAVLSMGGGCTGWQKMTSVWLCKKLQFLVQFWFYKINCGFSVSSTVFVLCVV